MECDENVIENQIDDLYQRLVGERKLYSEITRHDDPLLQYQAALCYQNGCEIEKDEKKAFILMLKSAEQGYLKAQYNFAHYHHKGIGTSINYTHTLEWLMRVLLNVSENDKGRIEADIGITYERLNNMKEALKWYKKSLRHNNPAGKYRLGRMYQSGEGIELNMKKAFDLTLESAKEGCSHGMIFLGNYYINGFGTTINYIKAKKWLIKAFETIDEENKGYVAHKIGVVCEYESKNNEAVKWFIKGVQYDEPVAILNLALCYERGTGIEQDQKKAFDLALKLVEKGHHMGPPLVGRYYYDGIGTPVDYMKSLSWFKKNSYADNDSCIENIISIISCNRYLCSCRIPIPMITDESFLVGTMPDFINCNITDLKELELGEQFTCSTSSTTLIYTVPARYVKKYKTNQSGLRYPLLLKCIIGNGQLENDVSFYFIFTITTWIYLLKRLSYRKEYICSYLYHLIQMYLFYFFFFLFSWIKN